MLLLLLFGTALDGQFSAAVDVVEVYATVTDGRGEPVRGLGKADFRVVEGSTPQEFSVFAEGEFPLSTAIAIDRSFSMAGGMLATAKSAARVFLGELRPGDESAVIAIGSEVEVVSPLSTDRAAQFSALSTLDAFGTTGLYDAVSRAIALMDAGRGRRVLVVLSDGTDRYSAITAAAALDRARAANVIVYPVAVGPASSPFFEELASLTGGRAFHLRDARQLTDTVQRIARELRQQYLLGYTPRQEGVQGGWRSIHVTVDRPGLRVRARDGYRRARD